MNDNCLAAVRINQDLCSRCKVCYSLCPFDAIDQMPDGDRLSINIQKCQVCGICSSACPVSAIETAYYDYDGMLEHVLSARKDHPADALVLMCRGNSPSSGEIMDVLASKGMGTADYIPMRVPCAGRIPTKFVFNALNSGIKNIISIQCQDEFCRMKEGTKIETRRMLLGNAVLQQLGYPEDAVQVVKYSRKAVRDNDECVGCGKCVFICPYGAISSETYSTPRTDPDKCKGCGACQMVCPHHAISVKGYEFKEVLESYTGAAKIMSSKESPSVLILSCQWSEYSALDGPMNSLKGKNALVLEVPCIKGMDPVHVVTALGRGFDGVMAVVCPEKDCKLSKGRDASERQMEVLMTYLKKLDLLDRFEMHEMSPRCEGELGPKFDSFCEKLAARRSFSSAREEAEK